MSDLNLSLGIDIGTSGIRTAVLDEAGALISTARVGHVAQDPRRIDAMGWWDAVERCLAMQGEALRDMGRSMQNVARIGVDGTSGTMVLTDAHLRPASRALMYNSSGFVAEAARIAAHAPDVHITKGTNSALARALCLHSEVDDPKGLMLHHQADFIIAKLRGISGASDHNNALKLGFDPETGRWPGWFDQLGLQISLPEVHPAGAPLGPVAPEIAETLGFSPQTIVHAGTTDSIAAFLAAAPLQKGAAVTSLGTTLAVKILTSQRIDDPEVGLYSHKVGPVWLAGGASNTGGGVLLSVFDPDEINALSATIDPNVPSPCNYYPLTKPGERFPVNDAGLRPRMTPRPADDSAYLHGLLESIARIEAQCYAAIKARGGETPTQIFTAGGGAANTTWTRIRERVMGLKIAQSEHAEASVGIARYIMQMA